MHGSYDKLVQFSIVSDQKNSFAVTLRHKECGRAPVSGLITRENNTCCNMPGDFRVCQLLDRREIGLGAETRYGTLLSVKNIFIFCAHMGILSNVSENTDEKTDNENSVRQLQLEGKMQG